MRVLPLLALSFCLLNLGAGHAQGVRPMVSPDEDRETAKTRIEAIEAEIRLKRQAVLSSGSEYERLQSQRALEQSEESLRKAKRAMEEIKKDLKPGTKAWDDELLIKDGRQFRSIPGRDKKKEEEEYRYGVSVPDVGPGAALDPRAHQHSWVGEPGAGPGGPVRPMRLPTVPDASGAQMEAPAGEVGYGRPAGYRNSPIGPIRDPREGLVREESPAAALPNAPIPPSTGTAARHPEESEDGGPILDPNAFGETGRTLPPLAHDGFTFDGPEGEILRVFPELMVRNRGEKNRGLALVKNAGRRLRSGDLMGALREADRLAQLAPGDPGVHELRALVLNRLGRYAEAEAAAARALASDATRGSAWRTLAWAQWKQGKSAASLRSAERALSLNSKDALALALKAYALGRLGRRTQALASIHRAAAINPRAFGPAAARAKQGAPVSPTAASNSVPDVAYEIPVWTGVLLAGGFFFGVGWFAFRAR